MGLAIANELFLNKQTMHLAKYDTDKSGTISLFEAKEIKDDTDLELYNNGLKLQRENNGVSNPITAVVDEDKDACVKKLEDKLNHAKDKNGWIGKAFNKVKQWVKLGTDAKECEGIIDDYKNGKITYSEAEKKIDSYEKSQMNSVNTATSLVTGVVSTLAVASAVMTGGLSLGVIAAAVGIGAATKVGLKWIDRATNNIKNDEFDAKQLGKDALSGALDGVVSVGTMGMGTSAVTLKTVTEQTAKQVIKKGILQGAKVGAISGATMSAGNYGIETLFEEDVTFDVKDFIKTTTGGAIGGAVMGGVMGGIGNKIQYHKKVNVLNNIRKHFPDKTDVEIATLMEYRKNHFPTLTDEQIAILSEKATELEKLYTHNDEVIQQLDDVFPKGKLSSIEETSARVKSEKSVFTKLANKFKKGQLTLEDDSAKFFDAIGDAYGTRVQLKALTAEETNAVIEKALKDCNFTREQLIQAMRGNYSGLNEAEVNSIKYITSEVLDELKEKQTGEIVEALIKGIREKKIRITELNNYGDELSSYFTERQVQRIIDANFEATGKPLTVITKEKEGGFLYNMYKNLDKKTADAKVKFKNGAVKDSGYATSQMNVEYVFQDGSRGHGELQIRGSKLNAWGDAEHIPYDIRSGKITETDTEYSSIYKALKYMKEKCYMLYQKYSTDVYNWYRLQEFAITTPEPQMPTRFVTKTGRRISSDVTNCLTRDGLLGYSH